MRRDLIVATAIGDIHVLRIRDMLEEDRRIKLQKIADKTEISEEDVARILHYKVKNLL